MFLYGKNEKFIYDNEYNRPYKYDLTYNKKIIHDDFWHGNPKIYNEYDINRVTKSKYSDIWKYDFQKSKTANIHGYELLTIWESEYSTEPEKIIEKIIKFLL